MARFALAALAASGALLVGASGASAATVDNPGAFTATFDGGQLKVLDNSATIPITSAAPVTAAGSIDQDGSISVPAWAHLPGVPRRADSRPDDRRAARVRRGVGHAQPVVGAATLNARTHVVATSAGLVNDTCRAGTSASPLELPLTTRSSGALAGTPYGATDGALTLVDSFTLGTIAGDNPANDATVADSSNSSLSSSPRRRRSRTRAGFSSRRRRASCRTSRGSRWPRRRPL